jgi:hypothetical protein
MYVTCIQLSGSITSRTILMVLSVFFFNTAISQNPSSSIEIEPYYRIDWYPEFSFVYNGRASTDYVKMRGNSIGLRISYGSYLKKAFNVKAGIGYYKYSFNGIRNENTTFGTSDARLIKYPSPLFLLFYTDRYWYNTLSVDIGVQKVFKAQHDFGIRAGIDLANYYTFSQQYHLADNSGDQAYKRKDGRYYGLSVFLSGSVLKNFGKISIGPSLILSVYDMWKTDKAFPEENGSHFRKKWGNGAGLGVTCNLSLAKK